ncbi:calcineurin-like phosphoesterase family protein [uncultured Draconibacterium sp.]|uniref:calcineurin-like phosphoesterase family protein n=1 Tax=uncultured Draconibacterium sp. TaxID=1573823 RepID=UPI0029C08604|nr:calcineurin-like phosphoesterase family protein [uncultured Draconibacterium sp.]
MIRIILNIVFLLFVYRASTQQQWIEGKVFEDLNHNGVFDSNESGIKGVVVSNQHDVVLTDTDGNYKIEINDPGMVFVVKPSGYRFQGGENNFPQFYYNHNTAGAPEYLKYPGVQPTGALPKNVDFAMVKSDESKTYKALIIGDPQVADDERLSNYRDGSIGDMLRHNADFYIVLGDIADDYLDIYPRENEIMGALNIPGYHVPGNHDVNYLSQGQEHQMETFKKYFGPEYYSFNYAKTHFVVLNNINYFGWNKEENKKGSYFGGLDEKQLTWLKNDLEQVPEDYLVVINSHIPFEEKYTDKEDIQKLFGLLNGRQKLLSLAGHLHAIKAQWYNKDTYWESDAPFEELIAGAACGSWWTAPLDEEGVPLATCMDGSPKGYFILELTGNNYQYKFIPANRPDDYQMRISFPMGDVTREDIDTNKLVVNWFTGKSSHEVEATIDGGKPIILENVNATDPFIERTIDLRFNKDNWTPGIAKSNHIWEARLPIGLSPGIHRIDVKAYGDNSKVVKAYQVFEIVE